MPFRRAFAAGNPSFDPSRPPAPERVKTEAGPGRGGTAGGIESPILAAAARGHCWRVPRSPASHPCTPDSALIRVALLVQPPVLRSLLVSLLATDPEVRVVDGTPENAASADVVVLSQTDPENEAVPISMLLRSPRSRVLALGADARRAVLYELRPHHTALGELSRQSLLDAVHGVPTEAA